MIGTEWDQFRSLDLNRVKRALKSPFLVDLRNLYRPEELLSRGVVYSSIGSA
jgi:UDPglucose 6-dehydrogenase